MTRERRKALILEAQGLLSGGASDHETVQLLITQGVPRSTAYHVVGAAWREWRRAPRRHGRDAQLGRALAVCDRAMRMALTQSRPMLGKDGRPVLDEQGNPVRIEEPDLRTYLAAAEQRNKLIGLLEKEQDVAAEAAILGPLLAEIFEIFRMCISNREELQKAMTMIAQVVSPKSDASSARVIEAAVVKRSPQLPPPDVNGNGASH